MANTPRDALIREVESFITYVDVLSYALALTWKGRHEKSFTRNRAAWHAAVSEIKDRFKDQVPLLQHIFFTRRPPLAPYSGEVDQWISMLSMSGLLDTYPMQDHNWVMTAGYRRHIIGSNRRRLAQWESVIKEMAEVFKERLKPT